MKFWQRLAAPSAVGLLVPLLHAGTAPAQEDNTVSILSDIMVPILVIIDKILDYWVNGVTGDTLTEPWGAQLVAGLSTVVQSLTLFFAQFSLLLPSNSL